MNDQNRPESNEITQPLDITAGLRNENPLHPNGAAAPPPPDIVIEN